MTAVDNSFAAVVETETDICVDCAMLAANGDLPEDDEAAERVLAGFVGYDLVVVLSDEEPFFSWDRCGLCKDSRGGDRFPAVVWFPLEEV